jgi:hypothetical protein
MQKGVLGCIVGAAALWGSSAMAWHSQGHMMTAEIAWQNMTPAAKCRATLLLSLNPMADTFRNAPGVADSNEALFVGASTWPDKIKSNSSGYRNDGDVPNGPNAGVNVGYIGDGDPLMHKYWHFVDIPVPDDGTNPAAPSINAEERIKLFTATIGSVGPTDELKSYDLTWLLHLVGDVHQPLHNAAQYDPLFKRAPHSDAGGNAVKLNCCGGDLHTFWDAAPGDSDAEAVAIAAAAGLPPPPPGLASETDPHQWVVESYQHALSDVYVSPIGKGPGPFDLDQPYKDNALKVANAQIALGGVRLANLLNSTLTYAEARCPS